VYGGVEGLRREPPHYVLTTTDSEVRAKTVIVTSGADPVKLGVPGEEALTGRGVSYCATCDAAFFKEQVVAVIGGGDSAVEEALFTTRYASRVYLIHRRDELRASKILQQRALAHEKIEPIWNTVVEEVRGGENGQVAAIALRDVQSDEPRELPVDGVFIFIGHRRARLREPVDGDGAAGALRGRRRARRLGAPARHRDGRRRDRGDPRRALLAAALRLGRRRPAAPPRAARRFPR